MPRQVSKNKLIFFIIRYPIYLTNLGLLLDNDTFVSRNSLKKFEVVTLIIQEAISRFY